MFVLRWGHTAPHPRGWPGHTLACGRATSPCAQVEHPLLTTRVEVGGTLGPRPPRQTAPRAGRTLLVSRPAPHGGGWGRGFLLTWELPQSVTWVTWEQQ